MDLDVVERQDALHFQHDSLNLSSRRRNIRLLQMLPSTGERLCFAMHSDVFLDTQPVYAAVSYEWGDDSSDHCIAINGKLFVVRQNLYDFLQSYRRTAGQKLLWIDALCIDQGNTRERNHQVAQMTSIYQDAEEVIVWLGLQTKHVGALFDGASDLARAFESSSSSWSSAPLASLEAAKIWNLSRRLKDGHLRDTYHKLTRLTQALLYLTGINYWRRIWIIQEILVSQRCNILCGTCYMPWKEWAFILQTAATEDVDYFVRGRLSNSPAIFIVEQWFARHVTLAETRGAEDILGLVDKFSSSRATDLHDKIYALLGIANDGHLVHVDYGVSVSSAMLHVLSITQRSIDSRNLISICRSLEISVADLYAAMDHDLLSRNLQVFENHGPSELEPGALRHRRNEAVLERLKAVDEQQKVGHGALVTLFKTPSAVRYCSCMLCGRHWKYDTPTELQLRNALLLGQRDARHWPMEGSTNSSEETAPLMTVYRTTWDGGIREYLATGILLPEYAAAWTDIRMILYWDPEMCQYDCRISPSPKATRRPLQYSPMQSMLYYAHSLIRRSGINPESPKKVASVDCWGAQPRGIARINGILGSSDERPVQWSVSKGRPEKREHDYRRGGMAGAHTDDVARAAGSPRTERDVLLLHQYQLESSIKPYHQTASEYLLSYLRGPQPGLEFRL